MYKISCTKWYILLTQDILYILLFFLYFRIFISPVFYSFSLQEKRQIYHNSLYSFLIMLVFLTKEYKNMNFSQRKFNCFQTK